MSVTRRDMIQAAAGGAAYSALAAAGYAVRFHGDPASVFIARNQTYEGDLTRTIRDGLAASGLNANALRGKRVLLKPNMVEPTRDAPHISTHPMIVAAAAEAFLGWGAQVSIGEAPGHVRDTDMALEESGIGEALGLLKLPFADLNYQDSRFVKNSGQYSKLGGFYFPQSVHEADLVVSLPKMKTHHWMGVTASMKNLYGTLPGLRYGWPKNVLHHNGIAQTVADISMSLPKSIAIVDAIECMEGDGPIMGTPKHMGLLVMGINPPAVDATCCRLMQLNPRAVPYLQLIENRLGPLEESLITQRGEQWQPLSKPFQMLDKPHLAPLLSVRG
jgi:uncharacterized protein (DUF362 family)